MVRATLRITASRAAHRRATLAEADPSPLPREFPGVLSDSAFRPRFRPSPAEQLQPDRGDLPRLPHDRRRPPPAGQEAFVTSAGAIGRCADEERSGVRPDKTVTPRRRRIG